MTTGGAVIDLGPAATSAALAAQRAAPGGRRADQLRAPPSSWCRSTARSGAPLATLATTRAGHRVARQRHRAGGRARPHRQRRPARPRQHAAPSCPPGTTRWCSRRSAARPSPAAPAATASSSTSVNGQSRQLAGSRQTGGVQRRRPGGGLGRRRHQPGAAAHLAGGDATPPPRCRSTTPPTASPASRSTGRAPTWPCPTSRPPTAASSRSSRCRRAASWPTRPARTRPVFSTRGDRIAFISGGSGADRDGARRRAPARWSTRCPTAPPARSRRSSTRRCRATRRR